MANTIIHKKSSVSGKSPLTTDLTLGEIAVNTYDGKIYIKKNDGTESIVEIVPITKVNIESVLTGDITSHTHTNISGNAATATNLATARTILLSGDVSGSTSFDGSSDVTITTSVADDSHNHVISNIDGLQTALNGKLNSSGNNDDASCNIISSGVYMGIGKGSGSVCMSVNDGYGNANLTFNHSSGKPDVTGNAGRITVNVDTTNNPSMSFQLGQGLDSGVATALSSILTLGLTSSSFNGHVTCKTPTAGDNSTKAATTAYVVNAISEAGGKVYNHTQASASTTWTINHNLNERLVDVIVSDSTYVKIVPDEVTFTSVNQITLTFFEAVSGYAKVIG